MAEDSCELCPVRIQPGEPKKLVHVHGGYAYAHEVCYNELRAKQKVRDFGHNYGTQTGRIPDANEA